LTGQHDVDRAQKIEFQAKSYLVATELFWWFAAPGLTALVAAALVSRPLYRREVFA
jgi:Ca-activated chloride channel family protein